MSYIGVQSQNQISPQFSREVINGDGSATQFTLIQDVPGFNADNIMVVVNNVIQEPVAAYTIKEDANGNPRVLDFGTGNVLSTTDECYVQHRGVGTLNMTPAAGSVNAAALQDNLKSGNVDSYTATAGQTAFTLTETPLNVNTITVFVNGIYQKPTTNYTVSGTTLTLTAGAVAGDEVDVIHNTLRTTVTHVADKAVTTGKIADDAVTGAKIENNPTIAGNLTVGGTLGVTGNVTASADLSVAGNLTVSGTTTTIDTTVTTSDAMVINNAGSDVGLKINSTSTGNILQLQDGGVDKVVVADGGNTTFSGNVAVNGDLTVDSSGNLLVGTTNSNPTGASVAGASIDSSGEGNFSVDGGEALRLNRKTSDGEILNLRKDGATVGSIGAEGSDHLIIGTNDTGFLFSDGHNAIHPWNISSNATRDNAIDLGRSTHRFKDLYLGGGVYLGGTASANKIDYYEELTSTSIDFGNGSYGTSGFSSKSKSDQHVTKIGNIVHVALRVTLTHSSNTNGTQLILRILPYTPKTNTSVHGVAALMSATGSGSAASGYDTGVIKASTNPATDSWPISTMVKPSGTSGTSTWQISFTYTANT